jgi:hypothetical protein
LWLSGFHREEKTDYPPSRTSGSPGRIQSESGSSPIVPRNGFTGYKHELAAAVAEVIEVVVDGGFVIVELENEDAALTAMLSKNVAKTMKSISHSWPKPKKVVTSVEEYLEK